jgi:hypothetical protein
MAMSTEVALIEQINEFELPMNHLKRMREAGFWQALMRAIPESAP